MRRLLFGLLAAIAVAAPAGLAWAETPLAAPAAAVSESRSRDNARVFDAVWYRVKREYYDAAHHGLNWDEIGGRYRPRALAAEDEADLYGVINEMLDLLDDAHAAAMSPSQARMEDTRDKARPMLGVMVSRTDGKYVLQDVRLGSPAESAGLELGWEIRTLNGRPFFPGAPLTDGEAVTLEVIDAEGAPRTVTVVPRIMEAPARRTASWAAPDVLVLTFDGFDRGVTGWIDQNLDNAPPGTRLILDIRSNRGGLVMEAEGVLGCFLPNGRVWAKSSSRGQRHRDLRVGGGCSDFTGPVAVLVSGASRSAAELVPGALQLEGRATIVGRQTAGAVLISTESRLPGGGRLNLSIQDVTLADGLRLEHRGVKPDIEAVTTLADRRAGRDPALEAAVRAVSAAPAPVPAAN